MKASSGEVSLNGAETLTNKTLTSPVLNGSITGTGVLDEDDMSSDSATALATQQSIKAYVDSNAGSGWAYISTSTISSSVTEVQITSGLSNAYDEYLFEYRLDVESSGHGLQVQVALTGTSYLTTNEYHIANSETTTQSASQTSWFLEPDNNSGFHTGFIYIRDGVDSQIPPMMEAMNFTQNSGGGVESIRKVWGSLNSTNYGDITAIKFLGELSRTWNSGYINVYGRNYPTA